MEKSDITRSSPNSKKIENTIKQAHSITEQNAKTSISNPVNRLSSLSGQKILITEPAKKNTPSFPMSSDNAKNHFKLNDFETQEIDSFDMAIYYAGQKCNTKVKGHPIKYVTISNNQPVMDHRKNLTRKNSKL
jgi:predicted metal-dependent phosphoesterase TrpH